MPWKCFLVKRTDVGALTLRRYSRDDAQSFPDCPIFKIYGYHNAEATVEERPYGFDIELEGAEVTIPNTDPRWPKACTCGYEFRDVDRWQPMMHRLWQGVRDGVEIKGVISNGGPSLPPGACWLASPGEPEFWDQLADHGKHGRPGPDGKYMFVKLPGSAGIFCPDGPAWHEKGTRECPWERRGTVPDSVIVTPSINIGGIYHGYIGSGGANPGWVSDDTDGRKYDENGKAVR